MRKVAGAVSAMMIFVVISLIAYLFYLGLWPVAVLLLINFFLVVAVSLWLNEFEESIELRHDDLKREFDGLHETVTANTYELDRVIKAMSRPVNKDDL